MMPAVAALDRILRSALNTAGGSMTPHVEAFVAKHGAGLTAAAAEFARSIDPAEVGPARWCSPRHRMPFHSRNEGSNALEDEP
jgi:hypothetical protein